MYRIISTFFSSMVNRYWLLATQSNLTCVCAALRSHSLFLSLFRSHCVRVTCVSNRIYVYWTEQNCPLLLVNSVLLSMGFFLARSSLFSSPTVLDNALFLDARYIFFFRWHCFLLYGYVLHTIRMWIWWYFVWFGFWLRLFPETINCSRCVSVYAENFLEGRRVNWKSENERTMAERNCRVNK